MAGVGLATGQALDTIAKDANLLLIEVNNYILNGNTEGAIAAFLEIAERVFTFYPFKPDILPRNWREILRTWLLGKPIFDIAIGQESETLRFIEGGLVYRLPWAMEAIRVRGIANRDTINGIFTLEDFELGFAVAAIETGTLNRSAAILIQAGFNSRLAAIKAVTDCGANFQSVQELRNWLGSQEIEEWHTRPHWPTPETRDMWIAFTQSFAPRENLIWSDRRYWAPVTWFKIQPPPKTPVQLHYWSGQSYVLAGDGEPLGILQAVLPIGRAGLIRAQVSQEMNRIDIVYLGPDDLIRTSS